MHSTFSDGRDPIEGNVEEAEQLGLTELTCVDHVRAGTDWVPDYVAAVRRIRETTDVELRCGIEAKLLDTTGALDLPDAYDGVDAIYAADHQVPLADGPNHPREVKARIAAGELEAGAVVEALVESTARALDRPERVVIAHFLSASSRSSAWPRRMSRRGCSTTSRPRPRGPARRSRSPSAGAARARRRSRRSGATGCRSCSARTATRARRSAATTTASRCCASSTPSRRDRRPADPLRVRGRRRAPASRPVATSPRSPRCTASATRTPTPPRSCRTWRSSSPPGTRRR